MYIFIVYLLNNSRIDIALFHDGYSNVFRSTIRLPLLPISICLNTPCVYTAYLHKYPKMSSIKYLWVIFLTYSGRLTYLAQHETRRVRHTTLATRWRAATSGWSDANRTWRIDHCCRLSIGHRFRGTPTTRAIRFLCKWSFASHRLFGICHGTSDVVPLLHTIQR